MNFTPKTLFLIDGLGALLSALLLGWVLIPFESLLGIPKKTLYFLAIFPSVFCVYDALVYRLAPKNWGPFLKGIAFANLAYGVLSIATLFYHFPRWSPWAGTYFILELLIILILVWMELKAASRESL